MMLFYRTIKTKLDTLKIGQKIRSIVIFAAIAPFLVISIFFYGNIYDAILTQTIQKKQTEISRMEPMIEKKISEATIHANQVKAQSFFQSVFTYKGQELTPSLLQSREGEAFLRGTRQIEAGHTHLDHIRIYIDAPSSDGIFSLSSTKDLLLPMDRVRGSYWHGIFEGTGYKELFCPSFYLTGWEKDHLGDLAYMLPFICNVNDRICKCYLCLYYSSDILKDILTEISNEDGTVSYLITDRDSIVTSTDGTLSGIYHFSYEDIYQYMFSSNNYMKKDVLGQTVYLTFKNIQKPGWFLVNVVPDSVIKKETRKVLTRYFLLAALILSASMLFTTRVSSSLAKRISSVISTMGKIREGNLVPMEEPDIKDEIGDLISTYNYMTARQKKLTDDLKQTADELRVAEVNALQAQINPHFLYNTLDTIQWMAMTGKESQVSETVQKLSRFYKLTLGKDMTNTTLEKEIDHASIYVDLQNIRFDNAVDFIVDIPEELLPHRIPRLTLQPIVENAILHGIREKESQTGCIVVTGWEDEKDIFLLISDDGVGIEEEYLPKILSKEGMNPYTRGTNIAIYNVHHRLQLLYGPDYGLSYKSSPGEGTEVMVHLPKI